MHNPAEKLTPMNLLGGVKNEIKLAWRVTV